MHTVHVCSCINLFSFNNVQTFINVGCQTKRGGGGGGMGARRKDSKTFILTNILKE